MVKRMSMRDARSNLHEVVGIPYYSGEPVVIERYGRPIAVVVSVQDYERYIAEREVQFERLATFADQFPNLPDAEAEAIAMREVKAVRAARSRHAQARNSSTPEG
jgi:prevent-host-death family protein